MKVIPMVFMKIDWKLENIFNFIQLICVFTNAQHYQFTLNYKNQDLAEIQKLTKK